MTMIIAGMAVIMEAMDPTATGADPMVIVAIPVMAVMAVMAVMVAIPVMGVMVSRGQLL